MQSPLPQPIRVATLLDGSEEYGLAQAIANIAGAHDRRNVRPIGVFLGRGPTFTFLTDRFAESACLGTGPLIPLRPVGKSLLDPRHAYGRLRVLWRSILGFRAWNQRDPVPIVHTHSPAMARVAFAAVRSCRARLIWHCHGPYNLRGAVSRWFVGFARRRIDRIICISRFVALTLPRQLQPRAIVVHNGVPVDLLRRQAQRGALRTRYGIRPDQPLVGLFGALMPRKGHKYFLQAAAHVMQRFPDVRFVIVGGATEAHRKLGILEDLAGWIHQSGVEHAVIQPGYLPDAASYMADCDVLTMPTIPIPNQMGEGFGLVMIEGMAQGVATIATDCGAPREVIENGVNGLLVPPRDAMALADAIIRMLSDAALRRQIGEAGARTVAQRFDSRVMAAKLEAVYADCVPPPG